MRAVSSDVAHTTCLKSKISVKVEKKYIKDAVYPAQISKFNFTPSNTIESLSIVVSIAYKLHKKIIVLISLHIKNPYIMSKPITLYSHASVSSPLIFF